MSRHAFQIDYALDKLWVGEAGSDRVLGTEGMSHKHRWPNLLEQRDRSSGVQARRQQGRFGIRH
jgi:hypothetical protein